MYRKSHHVKNHIRVIKNKGYEVKSHAKGKDTGEGFLLLLAGTLIGSIWLSFKLLQGIFLVVAGCIIGGGKLIQLTNDIKLNKPKVKPLPSQADFCFQILFLIVLGVAFLFTLYNAKEIWHVKPLTTEKQKTQNEKIEEIHNIFFND